jgi:PhnB protein
MPKVDYKPAGYHTLTAALAVRGGRKAIEFYEKAFGGKSVGGAMYMPDGLLGHAEIEIGDSRFMLSDELEAWQNFSPLWFGGTTVRMVLYVPDCDAFIARAVEHGAKIVAPVATQFYGDRSGRIEDPFGYVWIVSTHVEDVAPDEMERRAKKYGEEASKQ